MARLCYDDGGCNDTERCSPGRYGTDPPDTDCLLCVAGKSSTAGSACVVLQILRTGRFARSTGLQMSEVQRNRGEIQR